jgi:uncharacterized phage-like protein YoqJ
MENLPPSGFFDHSLKAGVMGHKEFDVYSDLIMLIHNMLDYWNINTIVSGGEKGFDVQFSKMCSARGIPIEIIMAHASQDHELSNHSKRQLRELRSEFIKVDYISEHRSRQAFILRNQRIIQETDILFVYWDHRNTGSTFKTLFHARKINKPIVNLFDLL